MTEQKTNEKLIITKRTMSVIEKTIEAKYEYMLNNASKVIDKKYKRYDLGDGDIDDFDVEYNYRITPKLLMSVSVSPTEHKSWCEKRNDNEGLTYNHIKNHEKCDDCYRAYGYSLLFRFEYKYENNLIILESFTMKSDYMRGLDVHSNNWETCFEKLEGQIWEGVEYVFCKCGNLCLKANGKTYDSCDNCFINSYKRTEEEGGDCCVCLQNEGCWTKLMCNHILHTHCWNKIATRECPLCRQMAFSSSDNPYN